MRTLLNLIASMLAIPTLVLSGSSAESQSTQTDISFVGQGRTPLAGTLTLPTGAAREHQVPALLLIQGSGPTDRDGNQRPGLVTDLLIQLADALARHGIATLRYDKRGLHANAAARPTNPEELTEFGRLSNFIADAAAAWRLLASRPEVDPARVGVFGHSEGGMLALEIAAGRAMEHRVGAAVVILAATPGRPLGQVLREQLDRLGRKQGAPKAVLEQMLDQNDAVLEHIRKTGQVPPDVPAGLKALYPVTLRLLWQGLASVEPAELASRYKGPVLVLQGAEDRQVSAERDAPALDRALSARDPDDHAIVIIPGVSHNLKTVAGPDDEGFAGPVAAAALEALSSWLATHGFGS